MWATPPRGRESRKPRDRARPGTRSRQRSVSYQIHLREGVQPDLARGRQPRGPQDRAHIAHRIVEVGIDEDMVEFGEMGDLAACRRHAACDLLRTVLPPA